MILFTIFEFKITCIKSKSTNNVDNFKNKIVKKLFKNNLFVNFKNFQNVLFCVKFQLELC